MIMEIGSQHKINIKLIIKLTLQTMHINSKNQFLEKIQKETNIDPAKLPTSIKNIASMFLIHKNQDLHLKVSTAKM